MTRVLIIWKVHLVQVQITGTASFNLPGIRMGDDYIAATPQPPLFFKGYNKVMDAFSCNHMFRERILLKLFRPYLSVLILEWYYFHEALT